MPESNPLSAFLLTLPSRLCNASLCAAFVCFFYLCILFGFVLLCFPFSSSSFPVRRPALLCFILFSDS